MASGVTYHVLPRWTDGRWRSIRALKIHYYVTLVALPLMVLALAIDSQVLFHMSAPLQAAIIALWIGNCLPFIRKLPRPTAIGFGAAVVALAIGIGLGMSFAVTPANGALLRPVHAEINLFGWAGLLITGVTYYLAPRFAGTPLHWQRLLPLQLGLTIGGLALSVVLVWLRIEGHDAGELVGIAHLVCASGLAMMGVMVAGTFASKPRPLTVPLRMMKPPAIR
jgi:cbb3-type cytochrome oxidase subunit 1